MSEPARKPLHYASITFLVGLLFGIFPLAFPMMTFWLRIFFLLIFYGIIIHLINRSPWTIKWYLAGKILADIGVMILILLISWSSLHEQWIKDHPRKQTEQPRQLLTNTPSQPTEQKKTSQPLSKSNKPDPASILSRQMENEGLIKGGRYDKNGQLTGNAATAHATGTAMQTQGGQATPKRPDIPEVQKTLPPNNSLGRITISTRDNPRRICKNHPVDDFSRQLEDKLKISVLATRKENNKQVVDGILSIVQREQETKLETFTSVEIGTCMKYEIYSIRVSDIFSDYDCAIFQVSLNERPPCEQPK